MNFYFGRELARACQPQNAYVIFFRLHRNLVYYSKQDTQIPFFLAGSSIFFGVVVSQLTNPTPRPDVDHMGTYNSQKQQ